MQLLRRVFLSYFVDIASRASFMRVTLMSLESDQIETEELSQEIKGYYLRAEALI